MKISNEQIELIKKGESVAKEKVDAAVIKLTDADLIEETVAKVNRMPDREDMIAELKAKIQAGTYNPSGDDIADAMIRRTIADRIIE